MAFPLNLTAFDHHFPYHCDQTQFFYSAIYSDFDMTVILDLTITIGLQSTLMIFVVGDFIFSLWYMNWGLLIFLTHPLLVCCILHLIQFTSYYSEYSFLQFDCSWEFQMICSMILFICVNYTLSDYLLFLYSFFDLMMIIYFFCILNNYWLYIVSNLNLY